MEFLEGFEEDDNPLAMSTSNPANSQNKAISPGLQGLLNPDDEIVKPPIPQQRGSSNNQAVPVAATTTGAHKQANGDVSDEDDILITGFGQGSSSQGLSQDQTAVQSNNGLGNYEQSKFGSSFQNELQHQPYSQLQASGTNTAGDPSNVFSSHSSLLNPGDNQLKTATVPSPNSVSAAATVPRTTIRPSSSLADHPLYMAPAHTYPKPSSSSTFGRIPLVGGSTASINSGSRTPASPYGFTASNPYEGYQQQQFNGGQGHYGSQRPYSGFNNYNQSNGQSVPGLAEIYQHQYAQAHLPIPSHLATDIPSHHFSNPSSHLNSPSSTSFAMPSTSGPTNGYRSAGSTSSVASSAVFIHPHAQLSVNGSANTREKSAVIDLTEHDDNDTGNENGTTASHTSGGSDDDVKISSEKLQLKAPEEEDDDFELVGERPSEATNPVCIGQLTGVALILYPIPELCPPREKTLLPATPMTPTGAPPPLTVALLRTTQQNLLGSANETIKLYSAQTSENFGVVEHRLANVLGPIMTRDNRRGLGLWVEAKVIRSRERSPMMLPLVMLLYCHPHLVKPIAQILEKSAIYLEHPPTYDPAMHNGFLYSNPHGGAISASNAAQRRQQTMNGLTSSYPTYGSGLAGSRYGQAGKSVEVQREQVEEMFKSIQSGADLGEAEPSPMIHTKLYPHQKQALAFLLDRERLRTIDSVLKKKPSAADKTDSGDAVNDELISLWRPRKDVYGRFIGWQHTVTEVEIGSDRPPPQCRGAILADDMGLGKTLVILSLIANTLTEARDFASKPPVTDRKDKDSFDALAAHPLGKPVSLSEFKSPLYGQASGMSSLAMNGSKNGKKKKDSKTQKKREDAESARLEKLQTRSRGTLIVCPLSTVVNWESQIEEHIGLAGGAGSTKKRKGDKSGTATPQDGLSIYIYHGNNRTNDLAELAEYDVVLTTFSTLGSEYSRQARKEEQDEAGSESSDGGIEELDNEKKPVQQKGKKRKRKKIEGDAVSPLQQIEWFRIVLDEAHMIKEHSTIQARAACELMAERRICLTGTPLQNSLNDLFSLMRFLRLEPFTDRTMWTNYIGAPAKVGDPLGISRLQLLMRHLALRRTKASTDKDGKPILEIPPKKDEIRYLTLDEQEKAFYASHHRRYKHNFEQLQKNDTLLKNYCSILQEVLRLRQICAHMALVRDSEDAAARKGVDGDDVVSAIKAHGLSRPRALRLLALLRDTGAAQCGECGQELAPGGLDTAQDLPDEEPKKIKRTRGVKKEKRTAVKTESDDASNTSSPSPVLTRCQHLFCLECFQKNVADNFPDSVTAGDRATCSICKEEISPVIDAIQVSPAEVNLLGAGDGDEDTTSSNKRVVEHSTKIRALVTDLFPLSQNNPASANYAGDNVDLSVCDEDPKFRPEPREATKTVVFSQWTKLLDRCEDALNECNIKFERLEGCMNRIERSKALAIFKSDMSCEVLLVSLRAGGVGLNLTHASRAYLMEPSWNPSVENQAVDRVHRIGQSRPVKTVRFVVKDSVEANMLEIQNRKTQLANLSLSQTLSKAQLAERRLEDLRTLFK